jgi:phospholipid/cholesterol/gamma-HCH transport system substrate-binding protein
LITSINGVFDDIDSGKGTLSKLLADDSLYNNLNKTAFDLDKLLFHINENPKHFFSPLGKSRKKIERDLKKQKKIN